MIIRDDKLRLVGWVGTPEVVAAEYEEYGCASIHPEEDHDHPIPVFRVQLIDGQACTHPAWIDRDEVVRCQVCGIRSDGAS